MSHRPALSSSDMRDEPIDDPVVRSYQMLASALAGRAVDVRFTASGATYSDGRSIHLQRNDPDRVIGLAVQGALLGATSLQPSTVHRLAGRPQAARRYVTLEATRAAHGLALPMPRIARERILSHWPEASSDSAEDSLVRALNDRAVPPAPPSFGIIRPRRLRAPAVDVDLTAHRAEERSSRVLATPPATNGDVSGADDEVEASVLLKLLSSPIRSGGSIVDAMLRQLGVIRSSRRERGDGASMLTMAGATAAESARLGVRVAMQARIHPTATTPPVAVRWRYPEWDGRRYRPNWCSVVEYEAAAVTDERVAVGASDHRLLRRLASIGLACEKHRRQEDGDDLDLDALVDFAVDCHLGGSPNPTVYQCRRRTAHDLGVLVLLDASSSTSGQEGEAVWDGHRELATQLVGALEKVGTRVAAYTFNSRGRADVRFTRIVGFGGRFDASATRRLAGVTPAGFTRVGAALRHGTHLLTAGAGTTSRLLVLISDGFAYDDGYENLRAESDTRRALDEARHAGVGCVCIGVATTADADRIDRLWGGTSYLLLDDPADLRNQVVPIIQTALRVAGATPITSRTRST